MLKKQKRKPQPRSWKKLDVDRVGGDGIYLLVDLKNKKMNDMMDQLIEDGDHHKNMTLEGCLVATKQDFWQPLGYYISGISITIN